MSRRLVVGVTLLCGSFGGCGADRSREPLDEPARCSPPLAGSAPTYGELFERYFAANTPGHCANGGCHGTSSFNVWSCGDRKDDCYAGMVRVGLVNPNAPRSSLLASPTQSPLSWVNPSGDMPLDATGPLAAGRDAVAAWVDACAQNN
jgi:hypothetical protein